MKLIIIKILTQNITLQQKSKFIPLNCYDHNMILLMIRKYLRRWCPAVMGSVGLLGLPGPASLTAITLNSYREPS